MTDTVLKTEATNLDLFRKETRAWLEENCPASMRQPVTSADDYYWGGRDANPSPDQKLWFERMLEKRWVVPHWPKPYGGGGMNRHECKVLTEEMMALSCRQPLFSFGVSMLGPALLKFATEEQKVHYLNEIVEGKIRWVQGYSEPGAGSDLAGLQTKAEDVGDHYLVNGQKVWTSYGDQGDMIFCLVRTDFEVSKHHGVSFLLVDMKTEGVSTAPIRLISGKSPFAETFLDNVKVPKENLIGAEGQGWTIAKYLLTHERQMIGGIGAVDRPMPLSKIAIEEIGLANDVLADTYLRTKIAEFEMDEAIFGYTIERVVDEAKAGNNSGALSSFFKYYYTELNKDRYEMRLAIEGFDGLAWEGEASNHGHLAKTFCRTKGNSIEGGTSEIQLNIISKRVLGLPG
jgi:acyl-CoA dehydrogenase